MGPGRRSRTRGSSTIELRLVRRRPPTRAATKAVSGQADIGREVLRSMWPSKGRGVTSASCWSLGGPARHATFAVPPAGRPERVHESSRLEVECPARHLKDDSSAFPMMGERAVSRSAFTAGGSAFPMMRERAVSCSAYSAGGSALPVMGRCTVSRSAFTAGGSVSP